MKNYTEEDEKYFESLELAGGMGLNWDERQELYEYKEWLKSQKPEKKINDVKRSGQK